MPRQSYKKKIALTLDHIIDGKNKKGRPIKRRRNITKDTYHDYSNHYIPNKRPYTNIFTCFQSEMSTVEGNAKDPSVDDLISVEEYGSPIIVGKYKDINLSLAVILNNSHYNHENQIRIFSVNFIFKLLAKNSINEKSILLKRYINKKLLIFPINKDGNEIYMIILNNNDFYYCIILCNKGTNIYEDVYQQLTDLIHHWSTLGFKKIIVISKDHIRLFNCYVHILFKLIDNFGYLYKNSVDLQNYLQSCGLLFQYMEDKIKSFVEQLKEGIVPYLLSNKIIYIDPQQ